VNGYLHRTKIVTKK